MINENTENSYFKENCTPDLIDNEVIINPKFFDGDSKYYKNIELEFEVPIDKVPDVIRMINFLKEPFDAVTAKTNFKITANNGEMPITEYDRIKETFDQLNVKIKRELKK